ncbi:DUF975 family protein [Alkaliphilus peptidifermentans]|uniref:DUF975 family protein n=1 Tax=Alkaliphilus peptidifermentans DSM 18978 TaxID=1120976 RepID=A0A1G5D732_9FIRM|nr:DUF975 family protein [Alkaliphilus peptidifermentans]SCY10357.1 Protein of unknown function [Alkaliphilus peptidifermentans DSM 18978]
MWTRAELKTRAKGVLRASYWKALLVSIIIAIVGGRGGGVNFSNSRLNLNSSNTPPFNNINNNISPAYLISILVIVAIIILFAMAFRVFLGYPLEVGGRRYFVRAAEKDVNMNYLGYSFGKSRYLDIVKTMLLKGVFLFLWTLLLIIPGIIKSYAYRMVPYILADNPGIGAKRAIELSNKMTDGEKFDMFVLDLSFIGWYILGALLLIIGMIFVMPYENSTFAELYLVLRQKAIDNGFCTAEELMINPE